MPAPRRITRHLHHLAVTAPSPTAPRRPRLATRPARCAAGRSPDPACARRPRPAPATHAAPPRAEKRLRQPQLRRNLVERQAERARDCTASEQCRWAPTTDRPPRLHTSSRCTSHIILQATLNRAAIGPFRQHHHHRDHPQAPTTPPRPPRSARTSPRPNRSRSLQPASTQTREPSPGQTPPTENTPRNLQILLEQHTRVMPKLHERRRIRPNRGRRRRRRRRPAGGGRLGRALVHVQRGQRLMLTTAPLQRRAIPAVERHAIQLAPRDSVLLRSSVYRRARTGETTSPPLPLHPPIIPPLADTRPCMPKRQEARAPRNNKETVTTGRTLALRTIENHATPSTSPKTSTKREINAGDAS